MTSAKATTKQPSTKGDSSSNSARGQGAVFVLAALDMTWRLVIAILVPVLGGYYLGQSLGANPALVIVGFIIAMILMTVVMWQQMRKFTPKITQADIDNARKIREKEAREDDK